MTAVDRSVPRVFETNNVSLAVRLQELGWQLFEVLAAPPSAGGSTFVLNWRREWPPRVEQPQRPVEDDPLAPVDPGGVRVGIEEIEAFLVDASQRGERDRLPAPADPAKGGADGIFEVVGPTGVVHYTPDDFEEIFTTTDGHEAARHVDLGWLLLDEVVHRGGFKSSLDSVFRRMAGRVLERRQRSATSGREGRDDLRPGLPQEGRHGGTTAGVLKRDRARGRSKKGLHRV